MQPSTNRHINASKVLRTFTEYEIDDAISYLTNPTRVGVWKLELRWIFSAGISNEISQQIKTKAKEGFKLSKRERPVKIPERYVDSMVSRVEMLSFLFQLFKRLVEGEKKEGINDYIRIDDEEIIFDNIDLESISKKYKEALKHFKEEIYFPGMEGTITSELFNIKGGSFLVSISPKDLVNDSEKENTNEQSKPRRNRIEIQSTDLIPLEKVAYFLTLAGKVDICSKYKVFSPEEELLSPYVEISRVMLPYLVNSDSIYRLFQKMISDYDDGNPQGTISAAGHVGEECLTQIYETLHREPVKQNIPLGGLRDSIGSIVKKRGLSQEKKALGKEDVIRIIKAREINDKNLSKVMLSDAKIIIDYIQEGQKKLDSRIKSLEGVEKDLTLFPPIIRLNLDNLIRLRNAVSHKTSQPIGATEALKSIYYSLSLYIWWDTIKRKIDWNKSEKDIIKQFVTHAES